MKVYHGTIMIIRTVMKAIMGLTFFECSNNVWQKSLDTARDPGQKQTNKQTNKQQQQQKSNGAEVFISARAPVLQPAGL